MKLATPTDKFGIQEPPVFVQHETDFQGVSGVNRVKNTCYTFQFELTLNRQTSGGATLCLKRYCN